MTPKDTSAPAFPWILKDTSEAIGHCGLTKREYFAAMAMEGFITGTFANPECKGVIEPIWSQNAAKHSFAIADAMLEEGGR